MDERRLSPIPPSESREASSRLAPAGVLLRPVTLEDASELAALYLAQREFLAPYEPLRPPAFFTEAGQRALVAEALALAAADRGRRFAIVADGSIVGTLAVSNIVRGAFQSANLGYFVAREWNGRGIAGHAVGLACDWAFGQAVLHRLEAATLLDNVASQRVLLRNRFLPIGVSRRYLRIAGRWRDHLVFARTVDDEAD